MDIGADGRFNERQDFDERGNMFLVARVRGGGFCVMMVNEKDLAPGSGEFPATVVATGLPTQSAAVAEATRMRESTFQ